MKCICEEVDNSNFQKQLSLELNLPITIEDIAISSQCVSIDLEKEDTLAHLLSESEVLSAFKGKMGVYLLWVKEEDCGIHDENSRMLAIYVGKGYVDTRIKAHLKTKWAKDEKIYISFFECENRIAKYIEQLFLDVYNFFLNEKENHGEKWLKIIWDEFRVLHGTETHSEVKILEKKFPEIFSQDQGKF